ncbi:MAG: tetratricopeptide repeat protein [Acidobacteria bacterium]|nr:tetratricopeptide repeat protein [Acidobacteriota bacterium]
MALNRSKILREAERFTQQGRIEQAIARFQLLVKENPKDVTTVNKVGDLYARIGKTKEAVKQFMKTAKFYATDGFLLKAIAIYKKVTKLDPGNSDAFLKLGDLYDQQGLPIEARTQYRKIAEKLKEQENFDQALEVYQKILGIDSSDVRTRIQIADLQTQQGNMKEALEQYTQVGEELRKKGKSEDYEKILEKALKADPSHGVVARSLAQLYCEKGEIPRAVSLARKVAEARPEDEDAVALLAETYLNSGSTAEAEQIIAQAPAKLLKGSAELQAILGRVFLAIGKVDEAEKTISKATGLFAKKGKSGESVPLLQEFLKVRPADCKILRSLLAIHTERGEISLASETCVELARELQKQGETSQARKTLKRFLETDAENAPVLEALESLTDKDSPSKPPKKAAEKSTQVTEKKRKRGKSSAEGEKDIGSRPEIAGEDFEGYYEDAGETLVEAQGGKQEPEEIEDEDFIQEHLTESEVFTKYRLIEKAEERLQKILERYPSNLAAHQRLLQLYMDEGDREKMTPQSIRLADLQVQMGKKDEAAGWLRKALEVVPEDPEIKKRLRLLGDDGSEEEASNVSVAPGTDGLLSGEGDDSGEMEDDFQIDLDLDEQENTESSVQKEQPVDSGMEVDSEPERPLQERLREVDFFLEQELWDEARGLLEVMRIREGEHPEVMKRWEELREREHANQDLGVADSEENSDIAMEVDRALGGTPSQTVQAGGSAPAAKKEKTAGAKPGKSKNVSSGKEVEFFDLASELEKELIDTDSEEGEGEILKGIDVSQEDQHSVEELFKAFRQGVEEQVDKGDYDTHYQLGIAYKEMGLVDEAIGEFQYAAKDSKLFLDCCSILGLCFKEKGMMPLAIGWYQKALKTPGFSDEDYLGIRYDLAQVLLETGKKKEAMSLLMEVYGSNSNYREVSSQIRKLQKDLTKE